MPVFRVFIFFLLAFVAVIHPARLQAAPALYTVAIPPLPDDLSVLLSSVSDCVGLQQNPPDTVGLLKRRMHNDVESFDQALKSRGYFKHEIEAELDETATPLAISFKITPGPRFVFAAPELILRPDNPATLALLRETLDTLKAGDGYSSSLVLDTETALLERLKENGHPSPMIAKREVVADHAENTVAVRFAVQSGPVAVFGPTEIIGLDEVLESYVMDERAWEQGAPFDRRLVEKTRENLIHTGLFRSVRIDAINEPGTATVTMRLTLLEALHRNVRAGLWFFSDLGLGVSAGWTRRNIFGEGQELRFDTHLSENLQNLNSALIFPNFGQRGHQLDLSAKYEDEVTDVYDASNLSLSGILRRPLSVLNVGYGLAYRLGRVDEDEVRHFNLFSVPLIAEFSTADHPLDPTSGLTLSGRMEPFSDIEDHKSSFVLWNISGRHYLPLRKNKSLVLATRGRYSLLAGTGRESIPEDMLLYAGGGGSVRGYAYQYAGQLDEDDDPMGGLSAVDFSAELRFRINKEFGFVLFGDGGAAFLNRDPSAKEDYFWGVGSGVRYYTPIGPVRMDVAVPLDRRDGVDSAFQLYVSLGQAF